MFEMPTLLVLLTILLIPTTVSIYVEEPPLCCGWQSVMHTKRSENVRLVVRIRESERGLREIRQIALAVSDPSSPTYGAHLKQNEIDSLTSPSTEDVLQVKNWLTSCTTLNMLKNRILEVECPLSTAETLLNTTFRHLYHVHSNQIVLRASSYTTPTAVATIFGLHGLPWPTPTPTPPYTHAQTKSNTDHTLTTTDSPEVNPSTIHKAYNVPQIKVSPTSKNRQAVVSFAGQTMNSSDLKAFFSRYLPDHLSQYEVSRFVGASGDGVGTGEASLDIQYMMGVSPGVKTEFWKFDHPADFCGQFHNWTSTMLADDACPLVNSMSYGWQGDMAVLGCLPSNQAVIEDDLAKLAAKGITVIVASGDSGSGSGGGSFAACSFRFNNLLDTALTGVVEKQVPAGSAEDCCELSEAKAFTYSPTPRDCQADPGTKDVVYAGVILINATVPVGTLPETFCCDLLSSLTSKALPVAGWTSFPSPDSSVSSGTCSMFSSISGESQGASGTFSAKAGGDCTVFSEVTGNKSAVSSISRINADLSLWSAWPAESPWVTAVGATTFVNEATTAPTAQNTLQQEMASTLFGSGGGFSSRYNNDHASWQSAAVLHFLKVANKAAPFPPSTAFNPLGRGTPDVSLLGQHYQVIVNGVWMDIQGTSASAPAFAGLISLLNEVRLQEGHPPMGFLNPVLYSNSANSSKETFTDIVQGSNAIGRDGAALKYGWNCTEGWDPATGLGTPNFDYLRATTKYFDKN